MTATRDLVEAHAFARRRVRAALVTGGSREEDVGRSRRTAAVLLGGLALAVLLAVGAAAVGMVRGRPSSDWLTAGHFVVSRETGDHFVVTDGPHGPLVQAVANRVSAQLVLGEAALDPLAVPAEDIAAAPQGPAVGIEGAPAGLPPAGRLGDTRWTACTGEAAGVAMTIEDAPSVSIEPDGGLLAVAEGRTWLVAAGADGTTRRFEVVADPTSAGTLADRLGFVGREAAVPVDPAWLRLVPVGPAISNAAFGVRRPGAPVRYSGDGSDLSLFRVGDVLQTPSGAHYLLADRGPQRLTGGFAVLARAALDREPIPVDREIAFDYAAPATPAAWPEGVPTPLTGPPCVALEPTAGAQPEMSLASGPPGTTDPVAPDRGRSSVSVAPGLGGFVSAADDSSAYVVDGQGLAHRLDGEDTVAALGYGDLAPAPVPATWLDLLDRGVPLSTEAAR